MSKMRKTRNVVVLVDNRIKNEMSQLHYPRYSLKFPDLSPRLEKLRGDCISKRRSQRRKTWDKKVSMDVIRTELYTSRLVQLIENTLAYPPQYPPQQQAPQPPMPSQAEMWAEIQRLRQTAQQAQQQVAEAQKREQMATYKIRRARGSGNLSFNWGENFRGAYLTPSKYQDGRVTIAGASMPATIQLQNTPQGPFIVATIQDGPLLPEEVELYNEWFVKPIEVIPTRRGRQPGTQQPNAPAQQPPQQYAPAPLPPSQPQYAPPSQYAPQPQYPAYAPSAPQQTQLPPPNALASIAHLPQDQQNSLVAEANKLMQTVPQSYPSLDIALQSVKRAHNIP